MIGEGSISVSKQAWGLNFYPKPKLPLFSYSSSYSLILPFLLLYAHTLSLLRVQHTSYIIRHESVDSIPPTTKPFYRNQGLYMEKIQKRWVQMSFEFPRLPTIGKEEKKRIPIPPKTRKKLMMRPRKCAWCRKQPVQEMHHIDRNPKNNNPKNLIGLCGTCHNRATAGEITKQQLWQRKGIKKATRTPKKSTKHRTQEPLEGLDRRIQRFVLGP